jgi:hypothetical protein
MMVMAKVLITGRSAFSQSAGLLSKNIVVTIDDFRNSFKNIQ